jgi:hypothetical protein
MKSDAFRARYEENLQSYLTGSQPYEVPSYDEEEAQEMHIQTFGFEGYKADKRAQEQEKSTL